MKKIILTFLIAAMTVGAYAQQDAMYTQFFANKIVVNPAYAGSRDAFSATALHREQWVGIQGAPRSTTLSLHSPFEKYKTGLGLSLVYDQLGIQRNYGLKFAYAYHIKTGIGTLSLGLDAQYKKQEMLWLDSNPLQADDSNIPYGNNSAWSPNIGTGFYLYKKNYYFGMSAPQMIQNAALFSNTGVPVINKYQRHYFAMGGVLLPLTSTFALKPAVLAKYEVNSPLEVDLNVMAIFNERFWAGMTYRTNDSFDAIMQLHLENGMRLGYSYDFTLTKLNRVNTGSHEIMLGFDFNKTKKGVYHPRYF